MFRESGFQPAAIWAAQILEERGNVDEAIRYVEQLAPSPIVGSWLGELYEKAGRREAAIEAYGDPALQPSVAEARQAIARLEVLQRG